MSLLLKQQSFIQSQCDLSGDIDRSFLDAFCESNGFAGWFETSAKENKNINEATKALVSSILEHRDIFEKKAEPRKDTFRPSHSDSSSKSGWCCNSF
jgi:hypothetical protein